MATNAHGMTSYSRFKDEPQILRDKQGSEKTSPISKYGTTRGQSVLWSDEEELKYQVRAHVGDSQGLLASKNWEDIIGGGVTHLTIQDDDNVFTDIPVEATKLKSLRSLTLMWSKVKSIPTHVLRSDIRELCLQECQLKHVDGIQEMIALRSLELINTKLKKIPQDIGRLSSLVNLNLIGNTIRVLPESIGNLQHLKLLNLCGNSLMDLPDSLSTLTNLTLLDVSHNQLQTLPAQLGQMTQLVTLRLSHNQLSELPPSCANMGSVKHVFLGNNRFTEVPRIFGKLNDLQTLSMPTNQITHMPASVRGLTTLLLDKNALTELSDPIFLCTNLTKLTVEHNQLTELSPLIDRLVKLRALYLGHNRLRCLPEEICNLLELRHLGISNNDIDKLPMGFDNLKNLSVVDIENTNVDIIFANALQRDGVPGLMEEILLQRQLKLPRYKGTRNYSVAESITGYGTTRSTTSNMSEVNLVPTAREPISAQKEISHPNAGAIAFMHPPSTNQNVCKTKPPIVIPKPPPMPQFLNQH